MVASKVIQLQSSVLKVKRLKSRIFYKIFSDHFLLDVLKFNLIKMEFKYWFIQEEIYLYSFKIFSFSSTSFY